MRFDALRLISRLDPSGHAVQKLALLVLAGAIAGSAGADPYLPAGDEVVLERLPRVLFIARDRLDESRRLLAADPGSPPLAARLAADYIEIGKRENDPRFYGYARAALKPWWPEAGSTGGSDLKATSSTGQGPVPPAILQLRAKLKERDHDYAGALTDLELLLDQQPGDVQAWVETANLHWVRGEYEQAWAACEALTEFADPLAVTLCRVPLMAVTGEAEAAYDQLAAAIPAAERENPAVLGYMQTMLGVIAEALGQDETAEEHYRRGLAIDGNDLYLMRAYSDFLLDQERYGEVLRLTADHHADTGLLLRASIAALAAGRSAEAEGWTTELANRFEEIRLRGGEPHGRYEARYTLALQHDPPRALRIALDNWAQQKQARDTRNVLEAALAAGDAAAAEPVLAFLKKHGTQDATLEPLVKQLERR